MSAAIEDAVPQRAQVSSGDRWDLAGLFPDDDAWEAAFAELDGRKVEIPQFKGTLGRSPGDLAAALAHGFEIGELAERLYYYAFLRLSEDGGDSTAQARVARIAALLAEMGALDSWRDPEIMAIPDETMRTFLDDPALAPYRVYLHKLLRHKPHTLSAAEERILAMQEELTRTPSQAFEALTDVDLDFGTVDTPEGPRALTQSSYGALMMHPDRDVRRRAYLQFLAGYDRHRNTLSALYAGSVQQDVFQARVRGHGSALEASLFADDVPVAVYDNLIATVREHLPALHDYYDLRRQVLGLDAVHLYDTRVPLVPDVDVTHSYEQAVDVVTEALAPLGREYCDTLRGGLLGGWVDRYENRGKRSGAFSAGSFHGDPYILMNYKADLLDDVFTLAHEAGHSMHSWYSARNNPFPHYKYTIFVAEVASTFNEQLLARHMMQNADSDQLRAYLVGKQVDAIVGTIFRQTMFAAFEKEAHAMVERNEPLTVDSIRATYRGLMSEWFGPDVALDDVSDIEALRIPHFFWAFYVYKYATGMAAAVALSQRVLGGGEQELSDYLGFLASGGSAMPLEQLRAAGVDMTSPEPIRATMKVFEARVAELRSLLLG